MFFLKKSLYRSLRQFCNTSLSRGFIDLPILLGFTLLTASLFTLVTASRQNQNLAKKAADSSFTQFNVTVWEEESQRRWGPGNNCSAKQGVQIQPSLGSAVFVGDELGGHFDVVNVPINQPVTLTLSPPSSCGFTCDNWILIKRSPDLSTHEIVKTGEGCSFTFTPETQSWRSGVQFTLKRIATPTSTPAPVSTSTPPPTPSPTLTPTLTSTPTSSPTLTPTPTTNATLSPSPTSIPTFTPSPTTTPVIDIGCVNLSITGEPKPGNTVNIVCQGQSTTHGIDNFRFRVIREGKFVLDLGSTTEINNNTASKSYTIPYYGCYTFECQACVQNYCSPWASNF